MTFEKGSFAQAVNTRKDHPAKNRHARFHNRPLLERFEPRVLLTAATGSVDLINRTQIIGWARDADTPNSALTVQIKVDGVASNVTAQQSLSSYNGTIAAGHGFTFTMPTLGPGSHTVTVSAADSSSGALSLLKSTTLINPAPSGHVDVISGTTVAGWVQDKDAGATSIQVRIDNNGSVGTPITASNARPDLAGVAGVVGTNHGFSVSGTFGVVDVYGLDSPTSNPVLLKTNSVKAKGHLDILKINRIAGWAWTPDSGGGTINIQVFVDGQLFQTGSTGINRPDLAGTTGGQTNVGFDFALNGVAPGKHTVQVFAIDNMTTSSNAKVLIGSGTLTNRAPLGTIDVVNSNGVSGWVSDPDAGATSIQYTIKVDDVAVITGATASNPRPDLTAVPTVGSPNHGFNSALSNLSAGPHKIQLFALDAPSGQEVLRSTKFINNTKPFGFLDIGGQVIEKGWAYDPDSPGTPVQVIVVLDGVRDVQHTANEARNDLLTVLPDANHAFTIQTPTHLAGTHTVKVIAIDTFTGEEVVIGTKTFTNKAPRGQVLAYAATGVSGWAQDQDRPFNSVQVLIQIDGGISAVFANRATSASLTASIGSPNHGFALGFSKLAKGTHVIKVFAVDAVTGVSTLIGSKNLVVAV